MTATSIIYQSSSPVQGGTGNTIVIPVHYLSYVRVVLGVWLAIWGVIEFFLAGSFIHTLTAAVPASSPSVAGLGALLAGFTLAGAYMVWRLFWVSRGREVLEFTPERLIVRRRPTVGASEQFDRSLIQNLHIGSYAGRLIYPSWGRAFLGKEEYFIGFDYKGSHREIARGVRRKDAERVVGLLQESGR